MTLSRRPTASGGTGDDATAARRRWRRLRALLAGGLTLGLGATATVAAWNDTETGTAEFAAGVFRLEANIDGSWNTTDAMTFNATAMYPGSTVYAPVRLRTSPDTTVAGDLTVTGTGRSSGSGAIADALEYRTVVQPVTGGTAPSCTAGTFTASAAYAFGSPTSWQSMTSGVNSQTTRRLEPAQGSTVQYCFQVRMRSDAPNNVQGTSAEYTWTWNATSVSPG